jgi:uncharacterized membrane protein
MNSHVLAFAFLSRPALAIALGMASWVVVLWAIYRRSVRPTRPYVYFGITVPADWPDSPQGRAVAAAYVRRVDVASAAALALTVAAALPVLYRHLQGLTALAGLLAQVAAATAAYLAGRRAVLPRAVAPAVVRRASLEADRTPTLRQWAAAQLGPFAVLAVSCALLTLRWPSIPDRVPVHLDAAGHADRRVAKSVGVVFGTEGVGALTCGLVAVFGGVTVHSGRRLRDAGRDDRYLSASLRATLAAEYFAAILMATVGWIPAAAGTRWASVPWYAAVAMTPGLAIVMGYFVVRRWPAVRAATADRGDGTPDRCWRLGLFYANPDDPAVLVPKRFGFGYTFNLARGGTWLLVLCTAAYVGAVVTLGPFLHGQR